MNGVLTLLQSFTLGPTATIILISLAGVQTLIMVAMGIVIVRQKSWQTTIHTTESALAATNTELEVRKERNDRLSGENRNLIAENAKLKAATDLEPLSKSLQDWVIEGRTRFDMAMKRLDEVYSHNSVALNAVLEELRSQRASSEALFKTMADSFKEQTLALSTHTLRDEQFNVRIVTIMDGLERRLSDTAVRIGMLKWSEPDEDSPTGRP